MLVRNQIEVAGIVQGVGFRPYVYRLATARNLSGKISNTSSGVLIEVQGPSEQILDFIHQLPLEAPALSKITGVVVRDVPCNGESEFRIAPTHTGEAVQTLISPDVAICDDCLREMLDPKDRRYRYPFINCTNCGPRFTIVRNIPYDRSQTSMSVFPMCTACQHEYDDPMNRRFHAQPNACWDCGPHVELWDRGGKPIDCRNPIDECIAGLQAGLVVAVKGLGGFHLAVDATNAAAVRLLRKRKHRVEKPFAVMVPGMSAVEEFCDLVAGAQNALMSAQRPIVLLPWRKPSLICELVAPNNRYVGIFLPYTPLQHLLFADGRLRALVMTSANISEEPIVVENDEAVRRLDGLADYLLIHNRDILLRCDDSVTRASGGKLRHLRRSRGFVPVPIFLNEDLPPVLAVGGELKNTICLTKGKHAFLSQHIGDLQNLESHRFFEQAILHLQRVLQLKPEVIAYDLHPDYFSTKWALAQSGVKAVGVQHHHAHIASCMAENQLHGRVIGFALDGTGYGTDGRIWGGEVLTCDYRGFHRAAHFDYVPLPGGEAAIHEPWRMAVSYLFQHFGPEFLSIPLAFTRDLPAHQVRTLLRMIRNGVNSPLTSSCGRLFDAVAALIGIRQQVNYEAQAAIEMEMAIGDECCEEAYPIAVAGQAGAWIIDTKAMFQAVIEDLSRNLPVSRISAKFHNGLVEVFTTVAKLIRHREQLNRVCLSGGSFHNAYLSERMERRLSQAGFEVFAHREVPASDGGLSLGQALVAAHRHDKEIRA